MQLCGAYWGTHGNVSEQTPIYRVVHGNMHALGQAYRTHKMEAIIIIQHP